MTTVGYGDLYPITIQEKLFACPLFPPRQLLVLAVQELPQERLLIADMGLAVADAAGNAIVDAAGNAIDWTSEAVKAAGPTLGEVMKKASKRALGGGRRVEEAAVPADVSHGRRRQDHQPVLDGDRRRPGLGGGHQARGAVHR